MACTKMTARKSVGGKKPKLKSTGAKISSVQFIAGYDSGACERRCEASGSVMVAVHLSHRP